MNHPPDSSVIRRAGFTLVEMLIAMTVLALILLLSTEFINQITKSWTQSSGRIEQFREARMAFETITQNLRQATLNVYTTYQYNAGPTPTVPADKSEVPQKYIRHSELQFITGQSTKLLDDSSAAGLVTHAVFFQAPLGVSHRDSYAGLNRLLCGRGYFIAYSDDEAYRPPHVKQTRKRFRLWEFRPPSESNEVYTTGTKAWYARAADEIIKAAETGDRPSHSRPVAENIIALIISPQVTPEDAKLAGAKPQWIAPAYAYDSSALASTTSNNPQGMQHLLPPLVHVTLVALDEGSAAKLAEDSGDSLPELVPSGAFTNCADFESDLARLEENLRDRKLTYRVFSSTLPLRNSKWSQFYK